MESFIIIYRKLIEWNWYRDSKTLHLFIHFLLKANWDDSDYYGEKVMRGQLITGWVSVNKDTGLTRREYRTCVNHLKSTGEITVKTTNKYSLVTIVKYNEYQSKDKKRRSKRQSNRPMSDSQEANGRPHTNNLLN